MARENITLHHSDGHTFITGNVGKYRLIATKPNTDYNNKENVFTDKIIEVIHPTSNEDISISGTTTSSAFLTGTDVNNLSLLYTYNENHGYTAEELNKAAITYIQDWNGIASDNEKIDISDIPSEHPIFFGVDGNGIYAIIEKDISFKDQYNKNIIVNINGTEYIKAYVKGTCSIIDADYSGINDFNMSPSIAYPFTFKYSEDSNDNTVITYLFINSSIELLYNIDTSKHIFKIRELNSGELFNYNYTTPSSNEHLSINKTAYEVNKTSPYIIKRAINIHNSSYKFNTTILNKNSTMINGTTVRQIIIPETITSISHFYGGSNANTIILPNSLVEIGEYAFYGSSMSGELKLRNIFESQLWKINKYAFSKTNNLKIFPYDLNDAGNRANIKRYLTSKCGYNNDVVEDIIENRIEKKNYSVIPRLYMIDEHAFDNSGSGSSIKNIIISKITYFNKQCFANNTFENIVIPKEEIFSSGYEEATICYIPSEAISSYYANGINGKTKPFFNTLKLTYSNYSSDFNNYSNYKNEANTYLTFENAAGQPNWYIIEDEVYTEPATLSEEE